MRERDVSDLVFRDLAPEGGAGSALDGDRAAELREELDKLRPREAGPRVVPAGRAADRDDDDTSASE